MCFVLITLFVFILLWFLKNGVVFQLCLFTGIMVCFMINSIVVFLVIFEFILLPMCLVLWGRKTGERYTSIFYFIVFTLVFSLPRFVGVVLLASSGIVGSMVGDVMLINKFISFILCCILAVKFPLYLFHFWLPRAHVEASTFGSIVLAACLLKLGSYAAIRFSFL